VLAPSIAGPVSGAANLEAGIHPGFGFDQPVQAVNVDVTERAHHAEVAATAPKLNRVGVARVKPDDDLVDALGVAADAEHQGIRAGNHVFGAEHEKSLAAELLCDDLGYVVFHVEKYD
jgi:hypothetical protein